MANTVIFNGGVGLDTQWIDIGGGNFAPTVVALGIGGGANAAVGIADGADVAEGATTDAAASVGGTGTVSAKLRLATTLLNSIAAGSPPSAATSGGASPAAFISDGSTVNAVVKNTAGQLYGFQAGNANTAACYLRFYDQNTAPTNSNTPVLIYTVPGGTVNTAAELVVPLPVGVVFANGIAYRVTTAANTSTGAAAANEVTASFQYK